MIQKSMMLLMVLTICGNGYLKVLAISDTEEPKSHSSSIDECGIIPDHCPQTTYRSFDGSCNNLAKPSLGTPNSRFDRLIPGNYGDGYSSPTAAINGNSLPNARKTSTKLFPDVLLLDIMFNLNAMQYGQIITHDMSLTDSGVTDCCSSEGQMLDNASDVCYSIPVPDDDIDYCPYNITCLTFERTATDANLGCIGNRSRVEQITLVTHFLDLSIVYGNSKKVSKQLRTFDGGKLKSVIKNGQEMLPLRSNPEESERMQECSKVDSDDPCYLAGDARVNQNPFLTVLQTLYMREHNRIANSLVALNPHWDDERIFQETRKINIAQHQHISYYEWLPLFIGIDNCYKNKILYDTEKHVDDYDPNVDPRVLNEHATAAFRFFHTLIAGRLNLVNELRIISETVTISDHWNRPVLLEQSNSSFDALTRGSCTQYAYAPDIYHDSEITKNWLRLPNKPIGQDLIAIGIQRGRDHGLASYNDYRQLCGLKKATTFLEFADTISLLDIEKISDLYEHPNDVDFTVGGSLEMLVPGTYVGPTFLCILTKQFYRTRVGDRFWFENSGEQGFTLPQLEEIRKVSISRIICGNTNGIENMQPEGFKAISLFNILVPCSSLPSVDLFLWKDTTNNTNSNERK